MLFYHISIISEERPWLDQLDGLIQTLSGGFNHSHSVRVVLCLLTYIVCLVEITVIAAVVQGDINVENIPVY
jgi:hypothetical protein